MDCNKVCGPGTVTFGVAVMFSVVVLAVGIAGVAGAFGPAMTCYASSLISLVAGLWTTMPNLDKKEKEEKLMMHGGEVVA